MKTSDLDIKMVENKFIITIDKNQIDADYILQLINWLQFESKDLHTQNISENNPQQFQDNSIHNNTHEKRKWNFSGSVDLNHQLDNINIRDFAYE